MELKKCVCNGKPDMFSDAEGYKVGCSRCGRETTSCTTPQEAIEEWNAPKSLRSMFKEVGENAVIIA